MIEICGERWLQTGSPFVTKPNKTQGVISNRKGLNKMGRPRISPDKLKSCRCEVLLTETQERLIADLAKEKKVTKSYLIRDMAFKQIAREYELLL